FFNTMDHNEYISDNNSYTDPYIDPQADSFIDSDNELQDNNTDFS
ncbi:26046_t:CDS:1, partial [Racocetra persica]